MQSKLILCVLLFIIFYPLLYAQVDSSYNSSEKFNKRGIFNNGDLSSSGKEIISDYDGNLIIRYATPLIFPNELSGEFSITYNSNVEHRASQFLTDFHSMGGYAINGPEWILGYKGYALQTLNFETNLALCSDILHCTSDISGQFAPLLILGYHFPGAKNNNDGYCITILRADGSKLTLKSVRSSNIGLFIEKGIHSFGFANVYYHPERNQLRVVEYKPGDGLTYYFEEDYAGYSNVTAANDIRTFYLTKITSYDQSDILEFHYEHLDPSNIYGRRVFTGITYDRLTGNPVNGELNKVFTGKTSNRLTSGYAYGELNIDYDLLTPSDKKLSINNYNYDDKITIKLLEVPDSLTNLYQDKTKSRILTVESIINKNDREDKFVYYNSQSGDNSRIWQRRYTFNGGINAYWEFNLVKEHTTYNKKKTIYNYIPSFYDGCDSDLKFVDFEKNYYNIPLNVREAFRDCYTNFMLKSKEVYDNDTLIFIDDYNYWLPNEYFINPSIAKNVDSIYTFINKTSNSTSNFETYPTINRKFISKRYSKFSVEREVYYATDFSSTLKLIEETVSETANSIPKITTTYEYDTGEFNSTLVNWTGSFYPTKDSTTKTDEYSSSYTITKELVSRTLDTLFFDDGTISKKMIGSEKWKDDSGLISMKIYNNFNNLNTISDTVDAASRFHKIQLPDEIKVYSGDTVKSWQKYEYFYPEEYSGKLAGKLKKEISNYNITTTYNNIPISREVTVDYEYFSLSENNFQRGFLKEKKFDNGVEERYEYEYFTLNPITIDCYKGLTNGNDIITTINSNGVQILQRQRLPLSIRTYLNDELKFTRHTVYDKKENLIYEVNSRGIDYGYLTLYEYDEAGRLIRALPPGNFSDGQTPDKPINIIYSPAGIYPPTITETKWMNDDKYLSTQIEFNAFGKPVKTFIKNESGTWEEKITKEYNFLGNVVSETQGGLYKTEYIYDVLGNLRKIIFPSRTDLEWVEPQIKTIHYFYGEDFIEGQEYVEKIISTDEEGKIKTTYYNRAGNLVAEQQDTITPTIFEYDNLYRLIKTTSPESLATTYEYDELGNIIKRTSPDEGTYNYSYDKYGNLRFENHESEPKKITFYIYDKFHRLTETGIVTLGSTQNFDDLIPDYSYDAFENDESNYVLVNIYDGYPNSDPFADLTYPEAFDPVNQKVNGLLTATAYRDTPEDYWKFKIYTYTSFGRIKETFINDSHEL